MFRESRGEESVMRGLVTSWPCKCRTQLSWLGFCFCLQYSILPSSLPTEQRRLGSGVERHCNKLGPIECDKSTEYVYIL